MIMGCGASSEYFDPNHETIQEFRSRQQGNRFTKMNSYEKEVLLIHAHMSIPNQYK